MRSTWQETILLWTCQWALLDQTQKKHLISKTSYTQMTDTGNAPPTPDSWQKENKEKQQQKISYWKRKGMQYEPHMSSLTTTTRSSSCQCGVEFKNKDAAVRPPLFKSLIHKFKSYVAMSPRHTNYSCQQ